MIWQPSLIGSENIAAVTAVETQPPVIITLVGVPQGKGWARTFFRGSHVGNYTPAVTPSYEGKTHTAATDAMGSRLPFDQPIESVLRGVFPCRWRSRGDKLSKKPISTNREGGGHRSEIPPSIPIDGTRWAGWPSTYLEGTRPARRSLHNRRHDLRSQINFLPLADPETRAAGAD